MFDSRVTNDLIFNCCTFSIGATPNCTITDITFPAETVLNMLWNSVNIPDLLNKTIITLLFLSKACSSNILSSGDFRM